MFQTGRALLVSVQVINSKSGPLIILHDPILCRSRTRRSKNSKLKILHNRLDWLYRHTWQCIWVHKEYCIIFFSEGFVPNIMTAKCKPRIKNRNKWIPQLQTESIYCKKETSRPPVTKCGRLGLCWNKLRIRTLFRISN